MSVIVNALREDFKNKKKLMEFSTKGLTPLPLALSAIFVLSGKSADLKLPPPPS